MTRLALYTTIYPGMDAFLLDWCKSVNNQDCRNFDIWVGVDNLETERLSSLLDENYCVTFVHAVAGDTPTSLRCRAIERMIANYDAIIFVDSDDILDASRVSAAQVGIARADVYGCALELMDASGQGLGIYFGLVEGEEPENVIPRNNFLGLSNTAWRSATLRKCLPVPNQCTAMDWLLATRAWGCGARITFDHTVRMRYRQHDANTACVMPPFSVEQIIQASAVVKGHYRILTADQENFSDGKRQQLRIASERIEVFSRTTLARPDQLVLYVGELNRLPAHRLWWMSVAHPSLEELWSY